MPTRIKRRRLTFQTFLVIVLTTALLLQILLAVWNRGVVICGDARMLESLLHHQSTTTSDVILRQIEDKLHCQGTDCFARVTRLQQQAQQSQPQQGRAGIDSSPTNTSPDRHPQSHPTSSLKKKACICAIVKNEERYIDEWVDYNLALGFDRIYLFDNSDDFSLYEWSQNRSKTENSNRISVIQFPGEQQQFPAYRTCVKYHARKEKMHYAAFFDADEFLVLKQHANIHDFLQDHLDKGQLSINWYIFGTSNHTSYQPIPLTKRYQYREQFVDQHVKSIAVLDDMKRGLMMKSPHFVMLRNETKQIDTNGRVIDGPFNPNGPTDVAVLYHYRYKSLEEWRYKGCVRGRADIPEKDQCNLTAPSGDVLDDTAWKAMKKYVPRMKIYDEQ